MTESNSLLKENKSKIDSKTSNLNYSFTGFQRKHWNSSQIDNRSTQMSVKLDISGHLDTTKLKASILHEINNTPILRTMLDHTAKEALYVERLELGDVEFSEIFTEHQNLNSDGSVLGKSDSYLQKNQANMLLKHYPMLISLETKSERNHQLLITVNSVLIDLFSIRKIIDNIFSRYELTHVSAKDTTTKSFRAFIDWQRKWMNSSKASSARNFWQHYIESQNVPLALPKILNSLSSKKFSIKRVKRQISPRIKSSINTIAKRFDTSKYNILLSVYQLVLYRYTGQSNIIIGCPTQIIPDPTYNQSIGNFANTIPRKIDIDASNTVYDIIKHNKQEDVRIKDHLFYPFEAMLEDLSVKVSHKQHPIFQTTLHYLPEIEPVFSESSSLGTALNIETTESIQRQAELEVIVVFQDGDNLNMELLYDASLISYETANSLADAIINVLDNLEEALLWTVRKCPLCAKADLGSRYATLEYNKKLIQAQTIPECILKQAQKTPCNIAVASDALTLTYSQLVWNSYLVSKELTASGVKSNDIIAVYITPGWEQTAALIGVMMSGAAYVPISTSWPSSRVEDVLSQISAKTVVSTSHDSENLRKLGVRIKTINVEYYDNSDSPHCNVTCSDECSIDSLAYIIFTSGSTGKPKGVAISHAGAVNTLLDINRRFRVSEKDSVFAISELSFDLSVYDHLGILMTGGHVVIPNETQRSSPNAWLSLLQKYHVTLWNSAPVFMQMLVDHCSYQNFSLPHLRSVWMSGDWIPLSLPNKINTIAPNTEIVSLGGATEVSIWSIYYRIPLPRSDSERIPYGKPLTNQHVVVLNPELEPNPVGVVGEIFILGGGLAIGYFGDEQKTKERFITHPATQIRLYKTGDMGRQLDDGNIELIGRIDTQVKINGMRIETSEIESLLLKVDEVDEVDNVNVLPFKPAQNEGQGTGVNQTYLVAYIVLKALGKTSDEHNELKRQFTTYLKTFLPAYMLPKAYVFIDHLPHTANGKLDRNALPKPSKEHMLVSEFVASDSALEKQLAGIWSELLQLPISNIGKHNSLLELGGNSMMIHRLILEIHKSFDVTFDFKTAIDKSTLSEMAEYIGMLVDLNVISKTSIDEPQCYMEI